MIARWYTTSTGAAYPGHAEWYRGGYGLRGPDGAPLDLCPEMRYNGDVRKLITHMRMRAGL